MDRLIQLLLVVCVAAVLAEPQHHRFSASHSDILSGLTWATLDLAHLGQPGHLASLQGLNLTLPDVHNNSVALSRPRARRLVKRTAGNEVTIELEVKFIVPLFTVYESDNLNFEMPMSYGLELPDLLKVEEGKADRRVWDQTVGTMLRDLEGLVSMLGVDGSGCVRKALCEVAAMPSIAPEGLVGEMVQLFVRHLAQEGEGEDLNTADVTLQESETLEEEENSGEEEPETESQKDGSGKEKQIEEGETDEHEEKKGKQKGSEKSKTTKDRSRRRRPRKIDEYVAAGVHGKRQGDCSAAFPECPLSLLQLKHGA